MEHIYQNIIIGIIILMSLYSLFRVIKKNFSSRKDGKHNCNKGCGCG